MGVFCLVHGSTQNASGWDLLVPELHRRGHRTITATLPVDEPEASATRYADAIVEVLPPDCSDLVLVGHSASGLFLPLVAARRPLRQVVFLAALIPKIGASLLDQFRANPDMLNPDWVGKDPTKDDEVAMEFLFHDCPPEIARWALTTRSLMNARGAMEEVCPLSRWPDVACSYIVCSEDRTISPEWSRRAARELLSIEPIELAGGHCPHVSRPAELAEVLGPTGATRGHCRSC